MLQLFAHNTPLDPRLAAPLSAYHLAITEYCFPLSAVVDSSWRTVAKRRGTWSMPAFNQLWLIDAAGFNDLIARPRVNTAHPGRQLVYYSTFLVVNWPLVEESQ